MSEVNGQVTNRPTKPERKRPVVKEEEVTVAGHRVMVDAGIAKFIRDLDEIGIVTIASCSGMTIDHGGSRHAYIVFGVPTRAKVSDDKPFMFPYDISSEENDYCQCLEGAIIGAGFSVARGTIGKIGKMTPMISGSSIPPMPPYKMMGGVSPKDLQMALRRGEVSRGDYVDAEKERQGRMDACDKRRLPDDEIDFRFGVLVNNIRKGGCVKLLKRIGARGRVLPRTD